MINVCVSTPATGMEEKEEEEGRVQGTKALERDREEERKKRLTIRSPPTIQIISSLAGKAGNPCTISDLHCMPPHRK